MKKKKQSPSLISRIYSELEILVVLQELVALKDIKDKYGKTEDYLRRQPLAWEEAKRILKEYKK